MSSHASINLQLSNGKFRNIYIHQGGEPDQLLPTLKHKFNSEEKVKKLLELGDAKCLGETLDPPEVVRRFSFDFKDNPEYKRLSKDEQSRLARDYTSELYSVFYTRDRGEKLFESITDYPYEEEYIYVFKDNEWFLYNSDGYVSV